MNETIILRSKLYKFVYIYSLSSKKKYIYRNIIYTIGIKIC